MTTRPQIGQWCITNAQAYKNVLVNDKDSRDKSKRYPITTTYVSTGKLQPLRAMYIGFRVIHEGITRLAIDGDDDGMGRLMNTYSYPEFKRVCSKVVWVFVANERSTPFLVFPEDVEFEAQHDNP